MPERCHRERCPNTGRYVIELFDTGRIVRACEVHTWPHFRADPATAAIWCGFCRKAAHRDCQAVKAAPRVLNMDAPPLTPEGYCCCTCNPYDPKVPGAGLARQPIEAARATGGDAA